MYPEIIAHRGVPRERRENTLPSFALALEQGAEGIELDVHATRDGSVVVHHDPWVHRPGVRADGRGPLIASLSADELHALDPEIPTLGEVLAMVQDRAVVYVEVKARGMEAAVVAVLRANPGERAVHSFDHRIVRAVHAMAPEIVTGVLLTSYLTDAAWALEQTGARELWQRWEMIDEELLDRVHGVGARVIGWTVNEEADLRRLGALGVDALCTDVTGKARIALGQV